MVSTRGVKFKFAEGEKVLCYEPDPTKAKVLYDSKVLEIIVKKDSRGRKCVEYLIHFQGWNSSWDRCVGEDYVLKDTDDNRRLQRTLSDKAQLQLRERKQQQQATRRRKTSDRASDGEGGGGKRQRRTGRGGRGGRVARGGGEESSGGEGGGAGGGFTSEGEDSHGEEGGGGNGGGEEEDAGESRDEEGGVEEEEEEEEEEEDDEEEEDEEDEGRIPLSLSDNLKKLLEDDGDLITCKNKLVRLPASPNVITILEGFMKQFALNRLFPAAISQEKRKPRNRHHHRAGHGSCTPRDYDKALRSLNLCKEVVDGIRIYFDHTLSGLLLYAAEKEQYEEEVASLASLSHSFRGSASSKYSPSPKHPIKQEQNHSCDATGRLSIEDFLSVQVKEEPRASYGDSDKESDLRHDAHMKSPVKEEKQSEEKGIRRYERIKDSCHDYKDDSNKFSRIESSGDNRTEGTSHTFLGAFHNTMSSAASTSSCGSTPSCVASPNRMLSERRPSFTSLGMTASEHALLKCIRSWKMIPAEAVGMVSAPSQLYGAPHLARLFVKLPDLLHASGMHEKKLKILLGYLHSFLEHLEEHTDWFGEAHYKENPSPTI